VGLPNKSSVVFWSMCPAVSALHYSRMDTQTHVVAFVVSCCVFYVTVSVICQYFVDYFVKYLQGIPVYSRNFS